MLSQGNISIFNKLFFYQIGLVIDPNMRNLQEIIGFLLKIQLYLNLYAYDRVITQNTLKCVENCSDDQLSDICSSTYYQFFCNLDYKSENSVFFGQIPDKLSWLAMCINRDQY